MIRSAREYLLSVDEAASYIRGVIGTDEPSDICIVLGSGLASLSDELSDAVSIPYSSVPGFPETTVEGHDGKLLYGTLEGRKVFLMSGRFHYYEGYDTSDCVFYVYVMRRLGVRTLYLTNAAGGILEDMNPAELMIITDHISFFCESPLRGQNLSEFGLRFPDQSYIYNEEYIHLLNKICEENGIPAHLGVYGYSKGPQYETPAEIQALKALGAGAVGMSTVPEAIAASHCGLKVAAVSCITNLAAGITKDAMSHDDVMRNAAKASSDCCKLARLFVRSLE